MFWLGQCSHAVEAYAKGRQVVEHGGGGWRQDTCHAKTDQCPVEPDDKAVVVLDAAHQTYGQLPQAHQLPQTVGGNGDVSDPPPSVRCAPPAAWQPHTLPYPPGELRPGSRLPPVAPQWKRRYGGCPRSASPGFLRPDSAGQREPPVPPPAEDRRCRSRQRAPRRWPDRVGRTLEAARRTWPAPQQELRTSHPRR